MVAARLKRLTAVLGLTALAAGSLTAEGRFSADLSVNNTVIRQDDENWNYGIVGSADLSFKTTGRTKVKGDFGMTIGETIPLPNNNPAVPLPTIPLPNISLTDLSIKARFPSVRLTLGKTRLSWGGGAVFNAGDVLFGSDDVDVNLTADVLRAKTDWLTSLYVTLWRKGFLEMVLKAPEITLTGVGDAEELSGGMRFYALAGDWKIETGYIADGRMRIHRPYLSVEVSNPFNIYLSGTVAPPFDLEDAKEWDDWKTTMKFSFGMSGTINLENDHQLMLRLESLMVPLGSWNLDDSFYTTDPAVETAVPGMLIYPEISWINGPLTTLTFRAIIDPVGASANLSSFVVWNAYQGFSLTGGLTAQVDSGDEDGGSGVFGWNRPGAFTALLGARYKY